MCGINGIYAYRDGAAPVDEAELLRVREAMARRGPDGAGSWRSADRRVGLANRRLAIQDLSDAGAQPMASRDGRYRITFNGEIYNYRTLREELKQAGVELRSSGDTEVVLQLYARHGAAMLDRLRGMYAFAIWDEREKALFLARDPFGIKPLYYADAAGTLRFASQVKALLAGGGIDTAPEPAGTVGFLLWGSVPEPFTLYRDIRALPAGASLRLGRGAAPRIATHFSVRDELMAAQSQARAFRPEDRDALASLLRDSVKHHLVSDVPVGIFLSAGVDSSLVTALAAEQRDVSLRSFTLGFEEYRGTPQDEVPVAELTAARYGTRHQSCWIRRTDFALERDAILQAMDQPTIDGVNMYFICREAARSGLKVALSGLGGDELFGGYPSFGNVPRLDRWLRPARYVRSAARLARAVLEPLFSAFASPKLAGVLEYGGSFPGAYLLQRALFMPWEIGREVDRVALHTGLERLQTLPMLADSIAGVRGPHARVAALEIAWYMRNQLLRDADWAGMAQSLEVRLPLVDKELFRALVPWLTSPQPPAKADAACSARKPLSADVLERSKSGFSVPVRQWLLAADEAATTARSASGRGLRAWARKILPAWPRQFRALVLVTDAFGGHGGIAKFNRDLLTALTAMPECAEVVAIPRVARGPLERLPERLRYFAAASTKGKLRYAMVALGQALHGPFDLVVAGHINLSLLAMFIAWLNRRRALLMIHGIDAWTPHRNPLIRAAARRVQLTVGVSQLSLERFIGWAKTSRANLRLLPNSIDLKRYTPGPKSAALSRKLGIENRTVIMTLGRLASEERYKGFDEVIEALPALAQKVPNIAYLVCGEGPDRARLEAKASELAVRERVVFAGFVPEEEKVEYYRLADAYVMPSRGEGFGIVFLEALACGLPVMGSVRDGSREALLDGALGKLVDPAKPDEVREGILQTLARGPKIPEELERFSFEAFSGRLRAITGEALASGRRAGPARPSTR